MSILRTALFAFAAFSLFSCEKAKPILEPDPVFEVFVQNDYFEVQAKYALFISNAEGETLAFRWLPSEDTAHIQVPGTNPDDYLDCTILKVSTLEAPGSGLKDTTLTLTTYTNISSGQHINLRDLFFKQASTLTFTLTGFNTLDSVVVSDALTLSRPHPNNNYYGAYLVNNTGQCWMRVLINGEPFWRFLTFNNVGPTIEGNTIDVSQLLSNFSPPLNLGFPFVTTWQYKLDGVVDTSKLQFFPLSDYVRAPGGAVPIYNSAKVFEPVNNDAFDPNRPYIDLFRLQTNGPSSSIGGYTYLSDNFYPSVPNALPEPAFDLLATTLANNRAVAVTCVGDFDLLAFSRNRAGNPNIQWEVLTKPANGIVLYILPDVPKVLAERYPSLKNYDFNSQVRARAEKYERLNYDQVLRKRLENVDPLWQARGGYLGREESF